MIVSTFDIRNAFLKIQAEAPAVDLAEVALGLTCIAVERSTGVADIRCASEYYADKVRFEYFGREDMGKEEPLPSSYVELADYDAGYLYLANLARSGLQKHVDFWFPVGIFRPLI